MDVQPDMSRGAGVYIWKTGNTGNTGNKPHKHWVK